MEQRNIYQERYWKELAQLKTHIYYLERYLQHTEANDNKINIFLAITSNTSICGWAIWNKYSLIWGLIIAISQLINAIKGFLPYKKRLKAITSLLHEFDELFLRLEMEWFDVSEGNLTEKEIHKLHMQIKQSRAKSIKKHIGNSPLPEKLKYKKEAEKKAHKYFATFYA